MPLKLPNCSTTLPSELFVKGSDLDNMVMLAADAGTRRSFRASSTIAVARDMLKKACKDYNPSKVTENEILCFSGETNGKPIRSECGFCRVGQFSAAGFFVGDIIPVELLTGTSNGTDINQ